VTQKQLRATDIAESVKMMLPIPIGRTTRIGHAVIWPAGMNEVVLVLISGPSKTPTAAVK
jgi:hypothetical protein